MGILNKVKFFKVLKKKQPSPISHLWTLILPIS